MRFFSITKPGIIFGNIVTLSGGFLLGSHHSINFKLLLLTILGMSLVLASGCVFNNCIDRDIDCLMARTRNRVLVQGTLSLKTALFYAFFLGIVGILILATQVNLLSMALALVGLFFYVVIYSLYIKRHSRLSTEIGAIAGAMPPVVGYCAAANHFDWGAVIVFLILFFWQIPHALAIAIYRLEDYRAAELPVLPVINMHAAKWSILIYTSLFLPVSLLPTIFGYTGQLYFVIAFITGLLWWLLAVQGLRSTVADKIWARRLFSVSIINISLLSLMMAF